ncbi:hypothetical protein A3C98_01040 [Candidatus Roizmanbacteria bacterium RIFCSPHIGHO2_02_FULL_37_15]|uniref:DUF1648 domain-containing protein n=1 Tax=Candidatus Roizmanbacteria bacterium RIFCSPLOWO2_01_FULL_37_16 TaxID=1802058 RepID=A0A1F7IPE3_9BACT|nr:MAG: hypothetical protein A2859_03325 [Candidatus Roizmanbacteria bacterium RIFCSPHIGHO2_01_FULL_37_16b]OGK21781.1 MAG: hypothetical protein A3C98_01040 [Candidatus Roizmanbacteria bacterium RIFCSPHIGHO2_02_FULL_37_15]OGK33722.1 MAG: hypothetical protein A3F57_04640 [Candidatus Roizmanbacteria bacterium RIFCSPHIGHO2_12_FULL_36_11]OGK45226.1 MAG: hypothetical protein A3B40_03215 [Candidatus Roizmanbacteria bacterium RIFCSPLOWO2_01_FULL_37_16]OGK57583.1 MAG: hypothetical protein A3I50_00280 [C
MLRRFRLLYGLIIANLTIAGVLFIRYNSLPPQIPLFYSKSAGEDQLADTWLILFLPFFLNFLYFFNNFFYKRYFKDTVLVEKIVYYLNIFIITSFTLIFVKIIFVVT